MDDDAYGPQSASGFCSDSHLSCVLPPSQPQPQPRMSENLMHLDNDQNFPSQSFLLASDHEAYLGASALSSSELAASIGGIGSEESSSDAIRAKIAAHPLYPKLVQAFLDCQKVIAPPEMADFFHDFYPANGVQSNGPKSASLALGTDPELDEFMESYCGILEKCKSDLARPFDEVTAFLRDTEAQLSSLCSCAPGSNEKTKKE